MEKLKYAQDLIKSNTYVCGGFNQFVSGRKEPRKSDYGSAEQWYSELQGYNYAKNMAKEEGVAFIYPFKCGESDSCFPFDYGGFFVCNTCGNKGVDKDWWKIKVEKDGNQFCCHGLDFINLQESENYAFGETFELAIYNYEKVMLNNLNPKHNE